jgi:hypothetical protein
MMNKPEFPKPRIIRESFLPEPMTEQPTDTEILKFLLNQFQAHSLQMNGESDWVFMNTGFPMSRAKGKSARDAVIAAMRAK